MILSKYVVFNNKYLFSLLYNIGKINISLNYTWYSYINLYRSKSLDL